MEALFAVLLGFVTFPGIFGSALLVGLGYMLHKWFAKTWPTEEALLSAVGTQYGKSAEQALRKAGVILRE